MKDINARIAPHIFDREQIFYDLLQKVIQEQKTIFHCNKIKQ